MHVSDVDLRLLRVFLTVVRSGGFTPAQAVLNVSQSTVSNHVKSLESRLGMRLCHRGRAGFELTAEGARIVEAAERLLHSIDGFRSEALALKGRLAGDIKVGVVDATISDPRSPIIPVLTEFTGTNPEVRPILTIADPQTLEADVTGGRLDVAIGVFTVDIRSLTRKAFYSEEQGFYCAATHPLFGETHITLDDVRKTRVISRSYWRLSDLQRVGARSFGGIANSMEAALGLILTGQFTGFLPTHVASPWVASRRMRQILPDVLTYTAEIVTIFRSTAPMPSLLSAFIEVCERHAATR